jgi:hypothetical protein
MVGRDFRFKTFGLDPDAGGVERVVRELQFLHGTDESINDWAALEAEIADMRGDAPQAEYQPMTRAESRASDALRDKAIPCIDTILEFYDFDDDTMRRGGRAAIAEILYGDRTKQGGSYGREITDVINYAIDEDNGLIISE